MNQRRVTLGRPPYRTQSGVWMGWGRLDRASHRPQYVTVTLGDSDHGYEAGSVVPVEGIGEEWRLAR